jgi:hypothetical protein
MVGRRIIVKHDKLVMKVGTYPQVMGLKKVFVLLSADQSEISSVIKRPVK